VIRPPARCRRRGQARPEPVLDDGKADASERVRVSPPGPVIVPAARTWGDADPAAARFEPALLVALAAWYPDRFTAPVAVDRDRAWSLTRDGGPTLRERPAQPGDTGTWRVMPRGYARLQFDLAGHADDLLALGLADLRPGSVPGRFERLVADPALERVIDAPGGIGRAQHSVRSADLAPSPRLARP
jgi:hypothetical protein